MPYLSIPSLPSKHYTRQGMVEEIDGWNGEMREIALPSSLFGRFTSSSNAGIISDEKRRKGEDKSELTV